jgi:alanyl-tRNA synthetase
LQKEAQKENLLMEKLGLNEIREKYLKFFESKGHLRLPSFSLIPANDPSLLLINSGMAPLKPYFTGAETPPSQRVTTCQKCIRTPDIENVGKTARHGTFFEMLGNFSFGDYFKKEATAWALEFITKEMNMPVDRLYITIYEDDDEAFEIWNKEVGIPADRIVRMGKKDNFWEHGVGPCGPCSEIYFDRGIEKGCGKPDCKVGCDCDRFIEFWNLVFTQFDKTDDGRYLRLAKPNIDTGMGLERLACVMQGVDNLFEVDTVTNILNYICKIAGVEYKKSAKTDVSIRVITDHIRSTTMMVSDGILPSNEGRGYVLRRLLRRAARHGKLLGVDRPFLFEVAGVVISESRQAYPELAEKADYIRKVIRIEEERFDATIDMGLNILNEFLNEIKAAGVKTMPGQMVFKLHDTYGFPLDLTREICEENGLEVDEEGFRKEMTEQRVKAREALKSKDTSAWGDNIFSRLEVKATEFAGYESDKSEAVILYIVKDNEIVDNAQEGDSVTLITDKTPFYAESGGQTGDTGYIRSHLGNVQIDDCKKTADGKYLHSGIVTDGIIEKGMKVTAEIDSERRLATARNHTVTHLIHKALRNALGEHVHQSGSHVGPERLRFDFTHFSQISTEELKSIEKEVNSIILKSLSVVTREMPVDDARKLGATALFGEKYGNVVRVVTIGDYSMELCGGTHLRSTAQAGLVKILGESGVAAGVRRIEALTGEAAIEYFNSKEKLLNELAQAIKSTPQDSLKKLEAVFTELKEAQQEIDKLRNKIVGSSLDEVLSSAIDIKGIKVIRARYDQLDLEGLRNTADKLKSRMKAGVVVLGSSFGGKVSFIVSATPDAVQKGIHSGNIIRETAKIAGGGGGGRPDMAQAGGRDIDKIDDALKASVNIIESMIK